MKINVNNIAKLANLTITADESSKLEKQLSETVKYIGQLNEIKSDNIAPTYQVTGLENVLRDDEVGESLSQIEALFNSKSTQNGYFKVKGILDNQ